MFHLLLSIAMSVKNVFVSLEESRDTIFTCVCVSLKLMIQLSLTFENEDVMNFEPIKFCMTSEP